jgi:hypothetical protein
MNDKMALTLKRWHEFVETQDEQILHEIIADRAEFYSPFAWKPKDKIGGLTIITTVTKVFEDFRYTREMTNINSCGLEFEARIGPVSLEGIDLIEFDEIGQIIEFKVMIRPANALAALGEIMNRKLTEKGFL